MSVTGGITIFTDSSVEISFVGISSTFAINEEPYEEDGQFKMKLGQDTYVKQ